MGFLIISSLLPNFQYGFSSSQWTSNLLKVVPDRIARVFNRSEAIGTVALDIYKAFNRLTHNGLSHKRKSYRILGHVFGLMLPFLSNRQLQVVLYGAFLQEYPVYAGILQGFILGLNKSVTTLMMLYVVLVSILIILFCTLSVIRPFICSNN